MRRFTRVFRTQSRSAGDVSRTALERELLQQAQQLFRKLSSEFTEDMNQQLATFLAGGKLGKNHSSNSDPNTTLFGGVGQMLLSTVDYLVSRPRTSTSTAESTRSREVDERFRLSQSQAAAEANALIYKGNKNL